ncbi:hypothetical protein F7Q91_03340 [Vibrio chagasii]|uniref:Lipoprotein n=1 Tax=Vibrio chagasii TaxID=170679 RepID=A0A7V7TIF0_9VIBR|nr:hypothetical protein [Vibrio chagasii]KAB0482456.1 hypothetical protein F7Q91_03340 [Vibrio chagasii]
MTNKFWAILFFCFISLTGCTSSQVVDHSEMDIPSVEERAFGGLEPYAIELLDELRLLAKTRSAKAQAIKPFGQRRQEKMLSTMVLPGFDKRVDWNCQCEVETIAKGIAEKVGYGSERVFTYGRKPPGGVWVNLVLNDQPIKDAISMIDAEKGAQVDFMIDHKVKTIVVKYLETTN